MSVCDETTELRTQVNNLVFVVNALRTGAVKDDGQFSQLLSATGIAQCGTCRRALSSSTDAADDKQQQQQSCTRCALIESE